MKRSLMVTLYLIVCLLEFHSTAFQLNLYQWQAVYKNSHIITAFLSALHRNLVGNLKFVLTPLLAVEKFHPDTFAVCRVKRIEVTELFRLFKARISFKVDEYLFSLLICQFCRRVYARALPTAYGCVSPTAV